MEFAGTLSVGWPCGGTVDRNSCSTDAQPKCQLRRGQTNLQVQSMTPSKRTGHVLWSLQLWMAPEGPEGCRLDELSPAPVQPLSDSRPLVC